MKIQTERITQWFSPWMYTKSPLKFLIWTPDVVCLRNWTAFPSKCMCKTCPWTVYLQIWDEFVTLVHNTNRVLSLSFWAVICCKPPPGSPDLAVGSHRPHHLWSAVFLLVAVGYFHLPSSIKSESFLWQVSEYVAHAWVLMMVMFMPAAWKSIIFSSAAPIPLPSPPFFFF